MNIQAGTEHFKVLNEQIRTTEDRSITIDRCLGQRYIGSGIADKDITINGTPGNALGAYLNGGNIVVNGNAQDATGDTMNHGSIVIHGNCGDATGYGMRGGKILIKGNVGYRAGIHMKAYEEQSPVMIVGGACGSFLGEYQAGGTIIVLGLGSDKKTPVGSLCCTGMHGGRIYLRAEELPQDLPPQVEARLADHKDMQEVDAHLEDFCQCFGFKKSEVLAKPFYVLSPNTKNPYKALYTVYL